MLDDSSFEADVGSGRRFAFGRNWRAFLKSVDEDRVQQAMESLLDMLDTRSLRGRRFIDVGSGSGLFSLAAFRLGAEVLSFDFDPQSVHCTRLLRDRAGANDAMWRVLQGSILDGEFVRGLGSWDVVYSWGVLHHTGNMRGAIDNAVSLVADDGTLFIAIYNDQGAGSRRWWKVKRLYNRLPRALRWIVLVPASIRIWGPTMVRDAFAGRPMVTWKSYSRESNRGMSPWRDVVDWVGGFPFEVATPSSVIDQCEKLGLSVVKVVDRSPSIGCNEFVFTANDLSDAAMNSDVNN